MSIGHISHWQFTVWELIAVLMSCVTDWGRRITDCMGSSSLTKKAWFPNRWISLPRFKPFETCTSVCSSNRYHKWEIYQRLHSTERGMAVSVIDATPIIPSSDHICELYLQISPNDDTTFWGHDVSSLAQKRCVGSKPGGWLVQSL